MYVYILFFLIIMSACFLALIEKKRHYNLILIGGAFFLLWIFCGFRYETGPDWKNYTGYLNYKISLVNILTLKSVKYTLLEPLFVLLCWFVINVKGGLVLLNILICFISLLFLFYRLQKINCYPLLGVMIFMAHGYFLLFSQIRQGIAICIFFYAIKYIQEKRLKSYLLFMLIAIGFHFSAALLVPMYFVVRMRFNQLAVVLLFIASVLFQRLHVVSAALGIAARLTGNPFLNRYYDMYVVKALFSGNAHITSLMLEWIGWTLLLSIFKKNLEKYTPYFNIFYNFCWMGLCIYVAFADVYVFSRIALYFRLSFLVLLPCFFYIIKRPSLKVGFFILLSAIIFIRWYTPIETDRSGTISDPNNFLPYKNILF